MWSILWRLLLMICLAPIAFYPLIGWPLIPVEFYLAISVAARVWKRVNAPA